MAVKGSILPSHSKRTSQAWRPPIAKAQSIGQRTYNKAQSVLTPNILAGKARGTTTAPCLASHERGCDQRLLGGYRPSRIQYHLYLDHLTHHYSVMRPNPSPACGSRTGCSLREMHQQYVAPQSSSNFPRVHAIKGRLSSRGGICRAGDI